MPEDEPLSLLETFTLPTQRDSSNLRILIGYAGVQTGGTLNTNSSSLASITTFFIPTPIYPWKLRTGLIRKHSTKTSQNSYLIIPTPASSSGATVFLLDIIAPYHDIKRI